MTKKRQKKSKRYVPTDGPTDRQADRVGHRVACTRLKKNYVRKCRKTWNKVLYLVNNTDKEYRCELWDQEKEFREESKEHNSGK